MVLNIKGGFMKLFWGVFLFFFFSTTIHSQNENDSLLMQGAVKVYLDCEYCSLDYIKENVQYINYVRDRKEAELHILFTRQTTGSGGTEFTITFIGLNKFKGMDDTLIYVSRPDNTDDEIRIARLKIMEMGLMRYVAKTPIAQHIELDYSGGVSNDKVEDEWDNWVFNINFSAWMHGQETASNINLWSSVTVDRITDAWKHEFYLGNSLGFQKYDFGDGNIYEAHSESYSFDYLGVKSLGEHWSVGISTDLSSSTYSNSLFSTSIYPAIEYNLFPYSESTRHQLRFLYEIGYVHYSYRDITIYNKMEEDLGRQKLSISYKVFQPWGSISTFLMGSCYLHDFSKNNLHLSTNLSLRLFKGLSFRVSGGFSLIHDQLSLPKGDATNEEIMLSQRELATQYSYWVNIGLTYTFGSIYNNIVNPRFGS